MDLQGPKLRLGKIVDGKLSLAIGQKLRLDLDPTPGTLSRVPLLHPEIFAAIKVGDDLLIDDGKVRLRVLACSPTFAEVEALNAGVISDRKGVNVPGAILPLSALTTKDREDLDFGLSIGVDWIALSFVQRPEDIAELKAIVGNRAWVMAKLEKPSAIDSLEAIVAAADGVMVARGRPSDSEADCAGLSAGWKTSHRCNANAGVDDYFTGADARGGQRRCDGCL
jgi:pyruvate kinase